MIPKSIITTFILLTIYHFPQRPRCKRKLVFLPIVIVLLFYTEINTAGTIYELPLQICSLRVISG
jgi:hypothetical protein